MFFKFNKKSLSYFILVICFTSLIGVASLSNTRAASTTDFKKTNATLKNAPSTKNNSITSETSILAKDSSKPLATSPVKNIKSYNTKKYTLKLENKNLINQQKNSNISINNIKCDNKNTAKKINNIKTNDKSVIKRNNTISNKEIINLLSNSYKSMRNLESFYINHPPFQEFNNYTYMKMPKSITSHELLVAYLNKNLNLNKYFTNDYIERLTNYVFNKKIDGQYYMSVGQFGQIFNMKNAKITSTKYEGNKLYVTFQGYYDEIDFKTEKATLVFDGTNWLVDTATFSPW